MAEDRPLGSCFLFLPWVAVTEAPVVGSECSQQALSQAWWILSKAGGVVGGGGWTDSGVPPEVP